MLKYLLVKEQKEEKMKKSKSLPLREEIPIEKTWKLDVIYSSDKVWEEELESLKTDIPTLSKYRGKLSESGKMMYEFFHLRDQTFERVGKLYVYAHLKSDQDTSNSFYQAFNAQAMSILIMANSTISFVVPEILAIEEEKIARFFNDYEKLQLYKKELDDINRMRPHTLSEKEEFILAECQDSLSTGSRTYSMLNNADLTFPAIKDEAGELVDVTHGRYIKFLQSKDRSVRKAAFEAVYNTYGNFKNTFASTLGGEIKAHNFKAKVRNYQSARQSALNQNNIPETVFDNLIAAVNEKLPLMHRYIELRKKVLGIDELHMYDLYTPLVKDVDMNITFEEAKEIVLKGLEPLGDEYQQILKEGFNNRWIDVEENKGKRSGAYSSGTYGTNPYILLNWNNSIDNTFTLAHELGHSLHSYYTRKNQPYCYGDYSIFVAEVASTCNEALLNDYLLKTINNKQEKLYILNHFLEGFRGTVFRQTMFAEFEHDIHLRAQNGEALTAEKLSEIYLNLNKKYYGKGIISDPEIALEWARIPHFYYNYYVYQYSTGYSAATSLASKILTEGESAVKRYHEFLKAGSSDYPIEVLKKAGVDITSKQVILDAIDVFEAKLNELEKLLLQ